MGGLKDLSAQKSAPAAAELALFADAADNRLDSHSFAEAALIASGVVDSDRRKAYLAQLDGLEAAARKELPDSLPAAARGEKLLQFLHAGPMKKGYSTKQSFLSVLLDSGQFNCVSATVLYNVMAKRLELDARAALVTLHVYSVLEVDGKLIDVETTNRRGFQPRDPQVLAELEKTTGQKRGSNRTLVGELGLLAVVYANHGVDEAQAGRHYEAALAQFGALALDASNPTARQNAKAAWSNWTLALKKQGEHEKALRVAALGLELAPDNSILGLNRNAVWADWLSSVQAREGEASARALAGTLLARHPNEERLHDIVKSHVARQVKELQKQSKHFEALELVNRHREVLRSASEVKSLHIWIYDVWADTHMKAKDWPAAIGIYKQGLLVYARDAHLENNLKYCQQQAEKAAGKP
jgi:tetratricopeptide (TPR) repeat protein